MTIKELQELIKLKWTIWEALEKKSKDEKRSLSDDELSQASTIMAEVQKAYDQITELTSQGDKLADLQKRSLDLKTKIEMPISLPPDQNITVGQDRAGLKPFLHLGEQLRSIYLAETRKDLPIDKRLLHLNQLEQRDISGMSEKVPADGGFALQQDFGGAIMESAVKTGAILSRCDSYQIGTGFNGANWVDIDETSIDSSIFGGVVAYWEGEGETPTATKPKLKKREMPLKKLFGLAYATDELMEDTTFVDQLYNRAFRLAIDRKMEGDVISGDGAGRPLGILMANSKVSVAKETNQAAATVVWNNLSKMWNRLLPDSRANSVWLVHPDVEEQLDFLSFPVGTGGVPVYLPAGGASVEGYSTLKGRPVIPTDHCSALGTVGDVILADLNDYLLIMKGGVKSDVSMHVRFIYGEQTFRFIYRANGQPKRQASLTIKNSSNARSSAVVLATRS